MESIQMTSHLDNEQHKHDSRVELLTERQKPLACLVCIYGILFAYNGKPRPEFSYNISLNAVVSVLATACKSSLIFVVGAGLSQLKWVWFQDRRKLSSIQAFEDASRGPMGSISLLFRHQGQSIASLGATILILMLAFEPFVQQILSYPTERIRTATETSAALTPQVQYYNDSLGLDDEASAYHLGLWTKDFNIEPTCPSGDCTWPSYKSLDFCNKCSDVTSAATLNCAMPASSQIVTQNATFNGTCEVVLPQGRSSGTRLVETFINGYHSLQWSMEAVWEVESDPVLDGSTYSGVENPLVVLAQSTLGFDNTSITNISDATEGFFIKKVTQCAFSLCVNKYNLHVTNSTAVLHKSSTDFGKTEKWNGPEIDGKSSLFCWAPSQTPNNTERHYDVLYWKDYAPKPVGPAFTYCDLEDRGRSPFYGYLFTGATTNTCHRVKSGWEYGQEYRWRLDSFNQVLALGLDLTASRIADSVTKTLLQNSNITIPGSTYANQVIVRVQWAWLILPTLLVVLGIVFLIWTTCASREKIIWKSSVLAFLFHGLEDQRERDNCMTGSGMEKLAEAMHVQLHPSQDDARVMLREN
ncbi:unnamed protein product [Penicillium salamii]|nr:unnamed protein product [Penicillium salamii]